MDEDMQTHSALFTLAHRRRDIRLVCGGCGHVSIESIDYLVDRWGPLYPLDKVAWNTRCRKCGAWEMRATPL